MNNKIEYLVALVYYILFLAFAFFGALIQIISIVGPEAIYSYQNELINYSFKRLLFLIILVLTMLVVNYIFKKVIKIIGLKAKYIKSKIFLTFVGIFLFLAYLYDLIQVYNYNG